MCPYPVVVDRDTGEIIMKTALGAGLALALLAGTALAQTALQVPPPPPPAGIDGPGTPQDPPPPPSPGDRGRSLREGGDMGRDRMWHRSVRPQSKAARFHIETSDVNVGIKCADDEPTKTCADFTLQLLDKLGSMSRR